MSPHHILTVTIPDMVLKCYQCPTPTLPKDHDPDPSPGRKNSGELNEIRETPKLFGRVGMDVLNTIMKVKTTHNMNFDETHSAAQSLDLAECLFP